MGSAPGADTSAGHRWTRAESTHNLVPVCETFIEDCETPVSAFLKLRGSAPAFLPESAEQGQVGGRDGQQQANAVAQLGERDKQRRAGLGDMQAARDGRQQRLGIVQVGDRGARGEGEQPGLASG